MRSRSATLSDRLFLVLTPLEKIYLDFLQTQFIDSSAIGALVHNLKASKQKEIELILINVQPPVMAVLSLTGLDAVFQIQFSAQQPEDTPNKKYLRSTHPSVRSWVKRLLDIVGSLQGKRIKKRVDKMR